MSDETNNNLSTPIVSSTLSADGRVLTLKCSTEGDKFLKRIYDSMQTLITDTNKLMEEVEKENEGEVEGEDFAMGHLLAGVGILLNVGPIRFHTVVDDCLEEAQLHAVQSKPAKEDDTPGLMNTLGDLLDHMEEAGE